MDHRICTRNEHKYSIQPCLFADGVHFHIAVNKDRIVKNIPFFRSSPHEALMKHFLHYPPPFRDNQRMIERV